MTLSQKLDFLQQLAQTHAYEPHRLYLIGLLAENAEDGEMTAEFLQWIRAFCSANR